MSPPASTIPCARNFTSRIVRPRWNCASALALVSAPFAWRAQEVVHDVVVSEAIHLGVAVLRRRPHVERIATGNDDREALHDGKELLLGGVAEGALYHLKEVLRRDGVPARWWGLGGGGPVVREDAAKLVFCPLWRREPRIAVALEPEVAKGLRLNGDALARSN